jgi:hypothetical protein
LFLPETFPLPTSPGGSETVCPGPGHPIGGLCVGALETDGNQRIKNRTVSVPDLSGVLVNFVGNALITPAGLLIGMPAGSTRAVNSVWPLATQFAFTYEPWPSLAPCWFPSVGMCSWPFDLFYADLGHLGALVVFALLMRQIGHVAPATTDRLVI